ncbi:single-stranded DNA-binding protein [Pediococcus pentosaceus]|uniref:single-stranded DNA-binding protein n=1 Tax=Pediococcus pentosaceus TaxID=1255 RepID=UPI00211C2E38|nr:single-stranded DNA-binding protein [Pediococcus pentosaceus]MCQ9315339.1 single-stranded DNA-binding protein [Pediococcus pentosaceus]MCQ9337851.1 single-stranded DNA-binding protein [Pediococcus pentosaceus]
MINRIVLVGRLTNDPELKYTGNDVAVATFTVAVNRQFTNSQGEREADFIRCQMWRKAAENFCNFTHKGSLVGIDGRIQTRSYENQQGTRIFVTEVVAENFSLLESKNSNQNNQNEQFEQNRPKNNGQNYQNKQNGQSAPNRNPNNPFNSMPDIKDDDLPF